MKYKSSHGTLFYYDPDLYIWKHANPTMLFLLGFESVTTYDNAVSDTILISKFVYQRFSNQLVSLENFDIFDDIYNYLSSINQTEDFDSYLVSSVHGLKLLLNDLTGITDDRTIPLIFHSDINAKSIDLSDPMYRLPESERLSKSFLDLQAQKICDIFDDAGFNRNKFLYRKSRRFLIDSLSEDELHHEREYKLIRSDYYDSFISTEINEYNDFYYERFKEMESNKSIIYKLDYASMYSYSLGVLYGCICLDYPESAVFKLHPKHWYNGNYVNLVTTAWKCFRFGYNRKYLGSKDEDNKESQEILNYIDIRDNKLKNYSDLKSDIDIHSDDQDLYNVYIDSNREVVANPIIYSKSTDTGSVNFPGSYADAANFASSEFRPIDEIVSSEDSPVNKGVISTDDLISMYIASDQVKIYRAYAYEQPDIDRSSGMIYFDTGSFLSHRPLLHFVPTGSLGWIEFNEDEWRTVSLKEDPEDSSEKRYELIHPNTLSLMPMIFSQLPTDYDDENHQYLYFGKALNRDSGDVVTYYKCLVTCKNQALESPCQESDHIYLYGIFDGVVDISSSSGIIFPDNEHFKSILSDVLFSSQYISVTDMPEEFSEQTYYDLSTPLTLLTDGSRFKQVVNGEVVDTELSYYGYTKTPSVKLPAYIDDSHTLTEYDLRYNSGAEYGYWSNTDRTWNHYLASDVFLLSQNTVILYTGEINLGDFTTYTHKQLDNYIYIYNDGSLEFADLLNPKLGFISIGSHTDYAENSLYNKAGVTEYLCPFIMKDDSGHYLTDNRAADGVPLVWYDSISKLYWNGLYNVNRWQVFKPSLDSSIMYIANEDEYVQVIDDTANEVISIDGSTNIPYDEFYADDTHGIVRYRLQVFNADRASEGIIDCLVDDKNDPDHPENAIYCIPGVTRTWVSRSRILPEFNYRFVDGMASLYAGTDRVDVVIDDDFID